MFYQLILCDLKCIKGTVNVIFTIYNCMKDEKLIYFFNQFAMLSPLFLSKMHVISTFCSPKHVHFKIYFWLKFNKNSKMLIDFMWGLFCGGRVQFKKFWTNYSISPPPLLNVVHASLFPQLVNLGQWIWNCKLYITNTLNQIFSTI